MLTLTLLVACAAPIAADSEKESACGDLRDSPVAVRRAAIRGGAARPASVTLARSEQLAIGAVAPNAQTDEDLCTGVLIAPAWVLTAAHCAFPSGPRFIMGSDLNDPEAVLDTAELAVHPSADLMLIRVTTESWQAARALGTQPLAVHAQPLADAWMGRAVELAGFGTTERRSVGQLRFVTEIIQTASDEAIVVSGRGRSGACTGDSGGPLLALASDGRIEVLGVLKRGHASCAGEDTYHPLPAALPWLRSIVGSDLCPPPRVAREVKRTER